MQPKVCSSSGREDGLQLPSHNPWCCLPSRGSWCPIWGRLLLLLLFVEAPQVSWGQRRSRPRLLEECPWCCSGIVAQGWKEEEGWQLQSFAHGKQGGQEAVGNQEGKHGGPVHPTYHRRLVSLFCFCYQGHSRLKRQLFFFNFQSVFLKVIKQGCSIVDQSSKNWFGLLAPLSFEDLPAQI